MRTLLATLILTIFSFSVAQAAEPVAIPKFGDWGQTCEKTKDGKEICFILQTATNNETKRRVMQIRIGFGPVSPDPVFIAILPLGAMIPPGAAFIVDGADPLQLPFLACAQEGCTTVGQVITPNLLTSMKKGDKANIRVALLNKKVIALPVSLKGFTRAYAALLKIRKK